MKYRVVITSTARRNLRAYCLHAAQHAPLTAQRWLNRMDTARPDELFEEDQEGNGDA